MYRTFKSLIAVGVGFGLASSLIADDIKVEKKTDNQGVTVKVQKINQESHSIPLRASSIVGMTVRDTNNKTLGSISDFVVDLGTGRIRYLAVSYGGFLGLGDKLFAVPAGALEVRKDKDLAIHYLVLDIPEEHLKNAPGFDQSNWPNFADSKWQSEVDTYYQKHGKVRHDSDAK